TMVTWAPATGFPSDPVTRPLTPADVVLCANAGAAASATIRPSDSFESRTRCLWVISRASIRTWMAVASSARDKGENREPGDGLGDNRAAIGRCGVNNRLTR